MTLHASLRHAIAALLGRSRARFSRPVGRRQGGLIGLAAAALALNIGLAMLVGSGVLAQTEPPVDGELLILPGDDFVVTFDKPIGIGPDAISGKSIAELIKGVPLHSPIEGLDKSLWQKNCSGCHEWTRERICEQAKTYGGPNMEQVLRLPHPYGLHFKVALRIWGEKGCP